ncbi:hypothetical protein ES707_22483 [subsurface metagenome]
MAIFLTPPPGHLFPPLPQLVDGHIIAEMFSAVDRDRLFRPQGVSAGIRQLRRNFVRDLDHSVPVGKKEIPRMDGQAAQLHGSANLHQVIVGVGHQNTE